MVIFLPLALDCGLQFPYMEYSKPECIFDNKQNPPKKIISMSKIINLIMCLYTCFFFVGLDLGFKGMKKTMRCTYTNLVVKKLDVLNCFM